MFMGGWSRRCWFSALLLGMALTASAQQRERPKLPPEIEALRSAAHGAPPELAADILLKLVEWGLVPAKPDRLELIEQAFQFAAAAKYPLAQKAGVDKARSTDSAPGLRTTALAHGFSTTGLRCRAVRAALPLDRDNQPQKGADHLQIPMHIPLKAVKELVVSISPSTASATSDSNRDVISGCHTRRS